MSKNGKNELGLVKLSKIYYIVIIADNKYTKQYILLLTVNMDTNIKY